MSTVDFYFNPTTMTRRIITAILLSLTLLPLYAQVDKQSKEYIKQRITNIYNHNTDDREFHYCSKDYYALYKMVVEMDEALVGEIGFFSYDHWIQAQDSEEPKMYVRSVTIHSQARATVKVCIRDFGREQYITFPLVYENKDWFMDDFITEYKGKKMSEKELMVQYMEE